METEKMIREIVAALEKLYWEDFEFIYKFVTGFAKRKHMAAMKLSGTCAIAWKICARNIN